MASAILPLRQLLSKVNTHNKGFLLGNREEEIWKRVMSLFILYIYIYIILSPERDQFWIAFQKNVCVRYREKYSSLNFKISIITIILFWWKSIKNEVKLNITSKWKHLKHMLLCVHLFKQIFLHSHVPCPLLFWGLGNQQWINRQKFLPSCSFHFSCRSPTLNYTSLILNREVTWQCHSP